jgi:hypothetical protein
VDVTANTPTPIQTILFGQDTADTDRIGQGWSVAGPSYRSLFGFVSDVWLDHPLPAETFVLELDLQSENAAQRICVAARGTALGRSVVKERRVFRYHLPGALIARAAPVRITIDHEDVAPGTPTSEVRERRHAPLRCFGLRLYRGGGGDWGGALERGRGLMPEQVLRRTGLTPEKFICRFESLGQNCEFGALQRQCGAEPLSLFRFGAPPIFNLIDCLRTGFKHFGSLENLEFRLSNPVGGEYMIREKHAWMEYHTFQRKGEVDESRLLEKNAARLKLLSRKLIEDLRNAEKIFVWKATKGRVLEAEVRSLHEALCTYGKVALLWVTTADALHPSGTVEELQPGLLKAYVHRFGSPLRLEPFDLQAWLELCVNAYLHFAGGGFADNTEMQGAAAMVETFVLPGPMHLAGMAHIQNRGDTQAGADGWIGVPGSGQAIEGIVVHDAPDLPSGSLTYQVKLADGTLSDPASPGHFCGTRGKNAPLLGIIFTLNDALASSAGLTCEGCFVGGIRGPSVSAGKLCRDETGAPLEALRLTLAPRG